MIWLDKICIWFMLYSAPVFFCTGSDLCRIPKKTICITAINTIYFLQKSQIAQFVPINSDIIASLDIFNSIKWKTYPMIYLYEKIQEYQRHNHNINERSRQQMPKKSFVPQMLHYGRKLIKYIRLCINTFNYLFHIRFFKESVIFSISLTLTSHLFATVFV